MNMYFELLVFLTEVSSAPILYFANITEGTLFFYRMLPVAPSTRATTEFNVSYPQSSFVQRNRYPLMGIYTEYPKINIEKNCSKIRYGQFRNENLHPHLKVGKYRTATCTLSGADTMNCTGRENIQDYIPRRFYLTFGFHCGWQPIYSLKGLAYNISFYNLSNKTNNCLNVYGKCSEFYNETSLPNLIGDEQVEEIMNFERALRVVLAFQHDTCYQHRSMWEFMCNIVFPKCGPITNQVIHPCREMCLDFANGCLENIDLAHAFDLAHALSKDIDFNDIYYDIHTLSNCGYQLPSNGTLSCFYKPVSCDSPSDVSNVTRILNITQKDIYRLHDVVLYACVNDTFKIRGTDSITCMYSGEWSHPPPSCVPVKKVKNSEMNFVYITLPVVLVLLLVVTVAIIKWKITSSPEAKDRIQSDNFLTLFTENVEPLL